MAVRTWKSERYFYEQLYSVLASVHGLLEEFHIFPREGSLGCPRAGSHWKSGHYFYLQSYGGVYGGQAV